MHQHDLRMEEFGLGGELAISTEQVASKDQWLHLVTNSGIFMEGTD
jgi:hypothetical protein